MAQDVDVHQPAAVSGDDINTSISPTDSPSARAVPSRSAVLVMVTVDGSENLTATIPKDPDELEKILRTVRSSAVLVGAQGLGPFVVQLRIEVVQKGDRVAAGLLVVDLQAGEDQREEEAAGLAGGGLERRVQVECRRVARGQCQVLAGGPASGGPANGDDVVLRDGEVPPAPRDDFAAEYGAPAGPC